MVEVRRSEVPDRALTAALAELQVLVAAGQVGHGAIVGGEVDPGRAFPVFDITGEVLMHRVPIRTRRDAGYLDVAAHPAVGAGLIRVGVDDRYDPATWDSFDDRGAEPVVVASSYPRLALGFTDGDGAVADVVTVDPVPDVPARAVDFIPPDLGDQVDGTDPPIWWTSEPWSWLALFDEDELERRRFMAQIVIDDWNSIVADEGDGPDELRFIGSGIGRRIADRLGVRPGPMRTVAYGTADADHRVCHEIRAQKGPYWCLAASLQMVLEFYRYRYPQPDLVNILQIDSSAGFDSRRWRQLERAVDLLTNHALAATWDDQVHGRSISWSIGRGSPAVMVSPGHARVVVGISSSPAFRGWWLDHPRWRLGRQPGIRVHDPNPYPGGTLVEWEAYGASEPYASLTVDLSHWRPDVPPEP